MNQLELPFEKERPWHPLAGTWYTVSIGWPDKEWWAALRRENDDTA